MQSLDDALGINRATEITKEQQYRLQQLLDRIPLRSAKGRSRMSAVCKALWAVYENADVTNDWEDYGPTPADYLSDMLGGKVDFKLGGDAGIHGEGVEVAKLMFCQWALRREPGMLGGYTGLATFFEQEKSRPRVSRDTALEFLAQAAGLKPVDRSKFSKATTTRQVADTRDDRVPFERDMTTPLLMPEQPQEFVIKPYVPEGWVTALSGDAGIGKTKSFLHGCVCVAAGKPFYGLEVKQGAVLALLAESTEPDYTAAVRASCKHLGVEPHAIAKRLLFESYVDRDAFLWRDDGKTAGPTDLWATLEARLTSRPDIRVVLLDSSVDVFDGNENDRRGVSKFLVRLTRLAQKHKVAIVIVCHESKSAGDNDSHAISGTTAWRYKAKSVLRLTKKRGEQQRTLSHTKHSFSAMGPTLSLEHQAGMFVSLTENPIRESACIDAAQTAILELLKEGTNLSPNRRAPQNYIARVLARRDARFTEVEYERAVQSLELFMIEREEYKHRSKVCERYRLQQGYGDDQE